MGTIVDKGQVEKASFEDADLTYLSTSARAAVCIICSFSLSFYLFLSFFFSFSLPSFTLFSSSLIAQLIFLLIIDEAEAY